MKLIDLSLICQNVCCVKSLLLLLHPFTESLSVIKLWLKALYHLFLLCISIFCYLFSFVPFNVCLLTFFVTDINIFDLFLFLSLVHLHSPKVAEKVRLISS